MKDQRIKTAEANALAVEGENSAGIVIAQSDALRKEKEAEASKLLFLQRKSSMLRHSKMLILLKSWQKLPELKRKKLQKKQMS